MINLFDFLIGLRNMLSGNNRLPVMFRQKCHQPFGTGRSIRIGKRIIRLLFRFIQRVIVHNFQAVQIDAAILRRKCNLILSLFEENALHRCPNKLTGTRCIEHIDFYIVNLQGTGCIFIRSRNNGQIVMLCCRNFYRQGDRSLFFCT